MHHKLLHQLQQANLDHNTLPTNVDAWKQFLNNLNSDYLQQSQKNQDLYQQLQYTIENKLIIERTRFISVLSALGDGLCNFDEKGQLFFSNSAAQKYLAYPKHCLEVWQHFQLHHPQNEQDFISPEDLLAHILEGRSYRDDEATLVSYGQQIPVSCIANPFFDSHSVSGFVFVFRDVSEQRKIKNDLHKAYKLAQEANTSKSQFLANMSHEIRTPMNGIIGISELLLKTGLQQEQQYYAKIIQDSSHALLHIINDILDLSKIEAGSFELESIEFNLYDTLEKLGELFSVQAEQKSLDLVLYCEANVPFMLEGDPIRIRQILFNLLGNALKFTERGEIILKVTREATGEDLVMLRFSILDTGIGIPHHAQAKLFSRFSQVDASTTRQYGGSGLGLSISKFLVELMGGSIHFDSTPDEGSTFWFSIPFKCIHQTTTEFDTTALSQHTIHAIILETHDFTRQAIQAQLKILGIPCQTTVNIEDTLALLQQTKPSSQVLITSSNIDEMEQTGLIKQLATQHNRLILTTYPSLHTHWENDNHYNITFTYLNKPIFLRKLQLALEYVITGHKQLVDQPTASIPITKTGGNILVVEDDEVNQLVVTTYLEDSGYSVEIANHGLEAMQKLENHLYDLIFMDCQMPHLDGFETTKQYRQLEKTQQTKHLPIIGLTAHAMVGDREKCLAAGMDDYMTKPVDFNLMDEMLQSWIID